MFSKKSIQIQKFTVCLLYMDWNLSQFLENLSGFEKLRAAIGCGCNKYSKNIQVFHGALNGFNSSSNVIRSSETYIWLR